MDTQTINAIATVALVVVTGVGLAAAAFAPYRVAERQRRDAEPSIIIEGRSFWHVEFGTLQELAVKPGGDSGIVGSLILGPPSFPPPGSRSQTGEYPARAKVLLQVTNAGSATAVGVRIPLRLSFAHLAKDAATAGDPDTLGLKSEIISHVVELRFPSLPPGERQVFILNETGVQISIESTGEAFDRPPSAKSDRRLSASTPAPIVLPESP